MKTSIYDRASASINSVESNSKFKLHHQNAIYLLPGGVLYWAICRA